MLLLLSNVFIRVFFIPSPSYRFTGKLRPAELSQKRVVPDTIPRPDYADHVEGYPVSEMKLKGNTYIRQARPTFNRPKNETSIKIIWFPIQLDDEEIEGLRVACKLGREVLDEAANAIAVGVTTDEIDRIVHEASVDRQCYPSPLNYYQVSSLCKKRLQVQPICTFLYEMHGRSKPFPKNF